jgi:hypothetical protein
MQQGEEQARLVRARYLKELGAARIGRQIRRRRDSTQDFEGEKNGADPIFLVLPKLAALLLGRLFYLLVLAGDIG